MADITIEELLTLAKAVEPLVNAYKHDELSKEERIFLECVFEVLGPVIGEYLSVLWKEMEPILLRFELWPPKGEDEPRQ